jgi:radical S-adenosyl methionine domain-containing protein 2
MKCSFCFARFKDVKPLGKEGSLSIVNKVANYGFRKINFVGGEPTLVPCLKDLLIEAKKRGLITSVVTNGWNIDNDWLNTHAEYLDWLGLSIDSLDPEINLKLGRTVNGFKPPDLSFYLEALKAVREHDVNIKINTVVNQLNKNERFHKLIQEIKPEKWKIFQVLIIENENPDARSLIVSREEFDEFLFAHANLEPVTPIHPEYCEDMVGSYIIIDPAGRFVDNSSRVYRVTESILQIGVEQALKQVNISCEKFLTRQDSSRMMRIVTQVNRGKEVKTSDETIIQ